MPVKDYSCYYQVNIEKSKGWFFVGILRSFENMAFDRTLDKQTALFEVFVPQDQQAEFVALMQLMIDLKIVGKFLKLPNRLES
jgi:hypothetical protein